MEWLYEPRTMARVSHPPFARRPPVRLSYVHDAVHRLERAALLWVAHLSAHPIELSEPVPAPRLSRHHSLLVCA